MKKIFPWILVLIAVAIAITAAFFMQPAQEQGADCNSFSYSSCPEQCVVCPPCIMCSSISCQTKEFCKSIGFDKSWYDAIEQRLKEQAEK